MEVTSNSIQSYFAPIGLLLGIIALTFAIFQDDIALQFEKPEQSRMEGSVEKAKEMIFNIDVVDKAQRRKARLIYMIIGCVGLIFSILSFTKRENQQLSILATSVCIAALVWRIFIFSLAIIALGLVIAVVLGG